MSGIFFLFCFVCLKQSSFRSRKSFLFNFESSFCSWDNHFLTFQILKCHDASKCLSMKHLTFYWITWEVNTNLWWDFTSLCKITKENFLTKKSMKMWLGNYFLVLLNFQKILSKMESEDVYVLIWTKFDSFTNTYLI